MPGRRKFQVLNWKSTEDGHGEAPLYVLKRREERYAEKPDEKSD